MRNINSELAKLGSEPKYSMNYGDVAFLASLNIVACLSTNSFDHSGDTGVSTLKVNANPIHSSAEGTRQAVQINTGHAAIGTSVKKIKLKIARVGTLVGNYEVTIRESDDTIKGISSADAVGLSTSQTIIEHTLDNCVEIEVDDRVCVEYDGTDDPNYINLNTSSPNWVTNTVQQDFDGVSTWADTIGGSGNRKMMFTFDSDPTI